MATAFASLICTIAAISIVVYFIVRWRRCVEEQYVQLLEQLSALHSQLNATRHELKLLKVAISAKQSPPSISPPQDLLDQMEQLSQSAKLADRGALEEAVRQTAIPTGVAADLFEFDQKLLDISRLINQGLSASQIAHRLHLPLGEVELLTSTRP
jgi:hypothetical protein